MPTSRRRGSNPDRQTALAQYRRRASTYDLELLPFEPIRRHAIAWLQAPAGGTVLDVGCGTGLSFEGLRQVVGVHGHVIGIEQSPEMIERARQRVRRHGWRNVRLLGAAAEEAPVALRADAALLHFTHDVMQSDAALQLLLQQLKPGATVVASGLKWAPAWALPVNLFVGPAAWYSVTSLAGLDRPWQKLADRIGEPELRFLLGGGVYLARFRVPAR